VTAAEEDTLRGDEPASCGYSHRQNRAAPRHPAETVARQIDLICVPDWSIVERQPATQIGG
jgi:hypothetical protein